MIVHEVARNLETTPALLHAQLSDDFRPCVAAARIQSWWIDAPGRQGIRAIVVAATALLAIFQRQRAGEAVAEGMRVGNHKATGARGIWIAEPAVRAPFGGVGPGVIHVRGRSTTDRKAAPLNDSRLEADDGGGCSQAHRRDVLEANMRERPQPAEAGLRAGVRRQIGARARDEVVAIAGSGCKSVADIDRRRVGAAGVEARLGADVAIYPDARVGARDVVEAGAVQRADLDVLDRLRLHRQVRCLCAAHAHCDERYRGPQ